MKICIGAVLIAVLASSAAATWPVSWTKGVAANGMDQYQVTLAATDGVISAIDISFTGAAINNVDLFGGGYQVFFEDQGTSVGWGGDPSNASNDSYIKLPAGGYSSVSGTTFDTATQLAAAAAITGTLPTSFTSQIVVPTGYSFHVEGSVMGGWPETVGDSFRADIPEPATMGLLAFGGIGLLRRRK